MLPSVWGKDAHSDSLAQTPGLQLITCVTLNMLFKLTKPQFPHL